LQRANKTKEPSKLGRNGNKKKIQISAQCKFFYEKSLKKHVLPFFKRSVKNFYPQTEKVERENIPGKIRGIGTLAREF
jgi:hypothetical protein